MTAQLEMDAVELPDVLRQVFVELNKNKDQQREIEEILATKYNIPRGTFSELLVDHSKIENLDTMDYRVIVMALYEVTKDERILPSKLYTDKEIKQAQKYSHESDEEVGYPFIFEGMVKYGDNEYVGTAKGKDLIKIWNKILTYNFQTQRPSKKKLMKRTNEIKRTPTIVNKSVKNITKLMLDGDFLPSTLVINILKDGTDNIEYDNGDLIIGEGTKLNLIDGAHRIYGNMGAIEINPDFDMTWEVSVRHYTLQEARYLIGLLNTTNRFDRNMVKFNTDMSFGGLAVKDLIQIKELRDRVETESIAVKKTFNMLTSYSVLAESVNSIFDPQSKKDQYDITDMLKKFYAYLISAYPDDFTKKMKESRSKSWFNHHNMHVLFLVVAKKLFDKYNGSDFPVSEITRIMDGIDFRKETGSVIDKIMIEQGNRNSNQSKLLIRKFAEEEVARLVD